MIYADNAATTKMSKTAVDAMMSVITENYGNPSSLYSIGQRAKEILEEARAAVAAAGKKEYTGAERTGGAACAAS